jgi:mono/diheme cytochrome c family protein
MKSYLYVFTALCLITSSTLVGDERSLGEADDNLQFGAMVGTREPQDSVGAQIFRRQCTVCHGNEGKGDGRAAVAFNPRPSDLTDADGLGRLSDEELLVVIGTGRASMPGFTTVLSPGELRAVTDYVRSLSSESGLK